jgi:hypothetical protein
LPAGKSRYCALACRFVLAASSNRAICYLLHDPFDGVGTPTALRAAAEAVVNLAHPQPLSGVRKSRTKLSITKHVARADDHDLVLTHTSGEGRNEGKHSKATTPPRHESYELCWGHASAPYSPCFGCRDIMHVLSPSSEPTERLRLTRQKVSRQTVENL